MAGNVFQRVFKLLNLTDLFKKSTRGRLPKDSILRIDDHDGNNIISINESTKEITWQDKLLRDQVIVKTALTGGIPDALDSVDGATLYNGLIAFVVTSDIVYTYRYVEGSTEAENPPYVIAPDTNATGRWILQAPSIDKVQANNPIHMVNLLAGYDRFFVNSRSTPVGFEDPNTGFSNLITNGGFEAFTGTADDGAEDTFDGWINASTGTDDFIEATTDAHGGSVAVKIYKPLGTTDPYIRQAIAVTENTLYRLRFWTKGDGTKDLRFAIYDNSNGQAILNWKNSGVTGTTYTQIEYFFVTPQGCTSIEIMLGAIQGTGTAYLDDVDLSEVIPYYSNANSYAPDGWWKTGYGGGTKAYVVDTPYGKGVKLVTGDYGGDLVFGVTDLLLPIESLRGRSLCDGVYIRTPDSGVYVKLEFYRNGSWNVLSSETAPNDDQYHWVEVSGVIPTDAERVSLYISAGADKVFTVTCPMLTYGSYIGEGNYVPGRNLVVLDTEILSELERLGYSSTSAQRKHIAQDTHGKILRAKRVLARVAVRDSSSESYTNAGVQFLSPALQVADYVRCGGRTNDTFEDRLATIFLEDMKYINYEIVATGVETLDIGTFRYKAVEV